jgi:hypothetical protein
MRRATVRKSAGQKWLQRGVYSLAIAGIVGAAGLKFGVAQENAAPAAPASVLPAEIPEELGDVLSDLPESWKGWGEEVGKDLAALYTGPSDAAKLEAIQSLRSRVQVVETALLDYRYQAARGELADVRGEILRRIVVAHAALDTVAGSTNADLRQAVTDLVAVLDRFDASHSTTDAMAARDSLKRVSGLAPDGGKALSAAVRDSYMNYNLRILASEAIINRIAAERRAENGWVDDCILGAKVDGCQTTWSNVHVDILPSHGSAKMCLIVDGQIASNTQGVTEQATIFTHGNHSFRAEKPIYFDGDKFWSGPAGVGVNANNTTVGAVTKYDWIPLFGSFAKKIAVSEATKKKGESEAIARGKIAAQVQPRFDSEAEKQFGPGGKLNQQIAPGLARLKDSHLYPVAKAYYSTSDWIVGDALIAEPTELAGDSPLGGVVPGTGAIVQIHESLMNNAIDRAQFGGRTFTEAEFVAEMGKQLTLLTGQPVNLPVPEKKEGEEDKSLTIMFDAADPIRFKITGGQLVITVKAAFKQAGKDETIPTQAISVPLNMQVEGDKVRLTAGDISVKAVERPDNVAEQVARAGVIKGRFEAALPPREEPTAFLVEKGTGGKIELKIKDIAALNGWLAVSVE